jgi:hypothetical protein
MGNEQGDVVEAFAQGRDVEADNVDAVEEILAEEAGGDARGQIAMGGGDEAYVYPPAPIAADRSHLTVLEYAEELCLHRERQLRDFIEKERPSVRPFEEARAIRGRAGKGATDVAEEGRFEEPLRDRSAIFGDERAKTTRGTVVDAAGDKLFAGARFPQN